MKTKKNTFKNVTIVEHPVLMEKLANLRDKETTSHGFRQTLKEISTFLAYEATRDLKVAPKPIETPLAKAKVPRIDEEVVIVSILRAGEGMLDGFLFTLPFARVGHVGIYRDKFMNNTVEYYFRIPESFRGKRVLLLDPLLATGDTALATLERLKQYGVGPITFVSVLSAEVGIQKINRMHPDVKILTASVEESLNEKGYLIPGLGDAGDRLFNTL
jgi:uracil phosphoribosyltransferase